MNTATTPQTGLKACAWWDLIRSDTLLDSIGNEFCWSIGVGMNGQFITDEQIARARALANEITTPIFSLIDQHTTVSVERTVLRWFGVDGVGAMGAPLVNLMVDRLKEAGVLGRGAAYWYGRALKLGARSPLEAVERLTAAPL